MDGSTLLILLTSLPLAGMVAVLALPKDALAPIRWTAFGIALLQVLIVACLWGMFDQRPAAINDTRSFQFLVHVPWIEIHTTAFGNIRSDFLLGLDGLSLPMVVLASALMLVAVASSWNIRENVKAYFALLLLVDAGIIGSFAALDLLQFFLFMEIIMVPMVFLMTRWGTDAGETRVARLLQFMGVGSVLLLLVIVGLYHSSNVTPRGPGVTHTFNMLTLMNPANYVGGAILAPKFAGSFGITPLRTLAFALLCAGFAIKLAGVPFHTWLPGVRTPVPVAILLVGVVLKLGGYGLLRIGLAMFPDVVMQSDTMTVLAIVGGVGVAFGWSCALAQRHLDRLIAYGSIAQMGFVMLGIASASVAGISGAVFQMFAHGVITAMLFVVLGVLRDRVGDVELARLGGIARLMPRYFVLTLLASIAAIGLPGLAGWWGQFLTLVASFQGAMWPWGGLAVAGFVLGAASMARLHHRMFLGTLRTRDWEPLLHDLTRRETAVLAGLGLLVLLLGLWPGLVLGTINGSVDMLVKFLETHGSSAASALNIVP